MGSRSTVDIDVLGVLVSAGREIEDLRKMKDNHPFKGTIYGVKLLAVDFCPTDCIVVIKKGQSVNFEVPEFTFDDSGIVDMDATFRHVDELIKDYSRDPSVLCLFMSTYLSSVLGTYYNWGMA